MFDVLGPHAAIPTDPGLLVLLHSQSDSARNELKRQQQRRADQRECALVPLDLVPLHAEQAAPVIHDRPVDFGEQPAAASMVASDNRPARNQVSHELLARARWRLGVGRAHVAKEMRIAAADGNWRDAGIPKRTGELSHELVVFGEHRAISGLEAGRERQCPADVCLDGHLIVEQHEQVVHHEEDLLSAQIGGRFKHVVPEPLRLAVHSVGDAESAKVNPQARRVGHETRDFLAGDEIGRIRMPIEELAAAIDAVVVGDAHQVHSTRFGHAMNVVGCRVALPSTQPIEMARIAGVVGVHVKVCLHRRLKGFRIKNCMTTDPVPRYKSGMKLLPTSAVNIVLQGALSVMAAPVPVIGCQTVRLLGSRPRA